MNKLSWYCFEAWCLGLAICRVASQSNFSSRNYFSFSF